MNVAKFFALQFYRVFAFCITPQMRLRPAAADDNRHSRTGKNSRQHPQHRLARVARGGRTRLCGAVCGGRLSRRRGCIRRGRIRRRARIVAERRNFHRVSLIPADRAFLVLRARLGRRRFFVYLPLEGVFSLIGFRTAVRTCMPVLLRAGRPFLRIIMARASPFSAHRLFSLRRQ